MYKRINTRSYNTETAKKIAYWEDLAHLGDYSWYEETLYRKRNGEYFLYGYGYAASKYSEPCPGGAHTDGCDIIPLGRNEAIEWAERHLDGDDVDEIFGPTEENDEQATFTLDAATLDQLDQLAQNDGYNRAAWIERQIHFEYRELKRTERETDEWYRLG